MGCVALIGACGGIAIDSGESPSTGGTAGRPASGGIASGGLVNGGPIQGTGGTSTVHTGGTAIGGSSAVKGDGGAASESGDPYGAYGGCSWECDSNVVVKCPTESIAFDGAEAGGNGGGPPYPHTTQEACELAAEQLLQGGAGGTDGVATCAPFEPVIVDGPRCGPDTHSTWKDGECQIAGQCCLVIRDEYCYDDF